MQYFKKLASLVDESIIESFTTTTSTKERTYLDDLKLRVRIKFFPQSPQRLCQTNLLCFLSNPNFGSKLKNGKNLTERANNGLGDFVVLDSNHLAEVHHRGKKRVFNFSRKYSKIRSFRGLRLEQLLK